MKKTFIIIVLLFSICLMTGCTESKSYGINEIGDQYIFDITSDNYLIYFHQDGCSKCESVYPTLVEYMSKANKENSGLLKIYSVNLYPKDSDGKQSYIFRKFDLGKTDQGENGDFYVNGVTSWGYFYIASTPSLIEIKTVNDKKEAKFIAQGVSGIEEYLNGLTAK